MGDKLPPHRFGPGYDSPLRTPHALGYRNEGASILGRQAKDPGNIPMVELANRPIRAERATRHDASVKRALLDAVTKPREIGLDEKVDISSGDAKFIVKPKHDERPLIDKVQEATFHSPVGLQWIGDKYALRNLLRKAHCFTIDDDTSEMIADFSVAIARDLDGARRLAIPPFPVTWIDINNQKRLDRVKQLGIPLTSTAAGLTEAGPAVERAGWLIHPADIGGHYMTYFTEVSMGVMMAPLSYWWHTDAHREVPSDQREPDMDQFLHDLTFGLRESNCDPTDAYPVPTPMHIKVGVRHSEDVRNLMVELAGELRHVWGLLIAMASTQFGVEPRTTDQPKHTDIRQMPNGKPLLPLEHKLLHLHLRKKNTPEKTFLRALTHHKHRWHEVRAHMRTLRNADGSVKKIIPIDAHTRGDEKLGKIVKTYKVEK